MDNNVVTIDFETGRKPPEKVRRTKVNMFDLPLEKMPVDSVFRLSWYQYENNIIFFLARIQSTIEGMSAWEQSRGTII